jgi:hypothetical protein
MKYRVHTYQVVRVTYEVEADSADEAKDYVDKEGYNLEPYSTHYDDPEWTEDFIVDPILPNGEIDYDNVKNYYQEK